MDPSTALFRIRTLLGKTRLSDEDMTVLVLLVGQLDEHLSGGGTLPRPWRRARKPIA